MPAPDYHGTDSFTVTVSDGATEATGTVSVTISSVNDAPIGGADTFATGQDIALELETSALLANDADVDDEDTLTVTAVAGGTHGTVTLAAGAVVFTPSADFTGIGTFDYTVSDGTATDVVTVTVMIGGANEAPVAVGDALVTDEDVPLVIAGSGLTANDTDAENQTLTVTAVANGTNGTVALAGGTVTFTPATDFSGIATFSYTVSDGTLTDTGLVTVTVTPVNDAPVALDDAASTDEDAAIVLGFADLTANDIDPDGAPLTVTAVAAMTGGTVTLDAPSSTLTFTPALNFNGVATFEYTVSDGTLTDVGLVTVTIAPVPDAPVAVADAAGADSNGSTSYPTSQFLANDTDGDGDPLSITAVGNASPATATVVLVGSTITFTPLPGSSGAASFEYTVSDGTLTSTGLVSLTIAADPVCGDGIVAGFEQCDDGDLDVGDGCTAVCQREQGYDCTGSPSVCTPVCGDGLVRGSEGCDDGNLTVGDGCGATCAAEPGFVCTGEPSSCAPTCGDGTVTVGEQCDDGNTIDTDGCTSECVTGVVCTTAIAGADRFAVDPVSGTCYAAFDDELTTLPDAQLACLAAGGHLATITSAAEQALVVAVQHDAQNPWIGGVDDANDTDAVFQWVTGEAFAFTRFATNQPDDDAADGGAGECLHLLNAAGEWNDTNCDISSFVVGRICELALDTCGDRLLQTVKGETCDDGNRASGDGCSSTCELETPFFSEYVEGTSNNKALEIRNPSTATAFDLTGCTVRVFTNGATLATTTLNLTATIPPDDVLVVCHPSSAATLLSRCDLTSTAIIFNGDDAVELSCGTTSLDVIGQIGFDPGTAWGTGATTTVDRTLTRKCVHRNGDAVGSDAFDPATEWDGFAVDTFSGLGVADCVP
ncbi:MAG: Ig-like domain-containing protein [Myxococcota bacterium]|nr:Ig-like domain-containing protein [Myxococcota bacterium]